MELLVQLVQAANAASRVVASALHICLCLTYAAHLYRHRQDWARKDEKLKTLRSLFLFPLMGGHRHAIFQVFAWGLWTLSTAITLPVYLSLLAADSRSSAAAGVRNALLDFFGLSQPLIPLTHVDAASGAAAVSGLWGELFMLKALLVFDGGARLRAGRNGHANYREDNRPQLQSGKRELKTDAGEVQVAGEVKAGPTEGPSRPRLVEGHQASLLVCLMGMALAITGTVLLLALEHLPDTASGILYCCLALSCVFIGASSTHGLGGHLRHCAGAASSAGAAVLRGGASAAAAAASAAAGAMHGSTISGVHSSGSVSSGGIGGDAVDEEDEANVAPSWRFFQPFQGGSVFVATQAIGWTLFSSTVVAVLLLVKEVVAGMGYCLRSWALAVGALMMATQLMLGVSILTYQNRRQARKLLQPVLHHPRASFVKAAGLVMPVVMMYLPLHVSCSSMASVYALLSPGQATVVVLAFLVPYFMITLRGHPAHSGCRRWEWLCSWFSREVEGSLAWWAGRLVVIRDFPGTAHEAADEQERAGEERLEEEAKMQKESTKQLRRYVLGFHPHGLYPTGAGFLPLMPSVQAAFPGCTLVTLTASIVHYLPGLRDIAGWAGFRQVTRATFRRALRDTGAVLLCPGGQAELVYADRAFAPRGSPAATAAAVFAGSGAMPDLSTDNGGAQKSIDSTELLRTETSRVVTEPVEGIVAAQAGSAPVANLTRRQLQPRHQLVIFAGHQGFVRLALEEGAWLVPVLALGETLQLRNLISAPEMQRATYKRLGFPVPFILAGRWGLTTLPLRNPLIYVVGRPLPPPPEWEAERGRQLAELHAGTGPAATTSVHVSGRAARHAPVSMLGLKLRWQRQQLSHGQHDGANLHTASRGEEAQTGGDSCGGGQGAGPPGHGHVVVPQPLVDDYHFRFYAALAALWRRYHHQHPVLRHAELLLEWGKHGPPPGFEHYLQQAEEEQAARNDAVFAKVL